MQSHEHYLSSVYPQQALFATSCSTQSWAYGATAGRVPGPVPSQTISFQPPVHTARVDPSVYCDYCRGRYPVSMTKCPNCGAPSGA